MDIACNFSVSFFYSWAHHSHPSCLPSGPLAEKEKGESIYYNNILTKPKTQKFLFNFRNFYVQLKMYLRLNMLDFDDNLEIYWARYGISAYKKPSSKNIAGIFLTLSASGE